MIVIGNWKMYLSVDESLALAKELAEAKVSDAVEVVVCPSSIVAGSVQEILKSTHIVLGGQNISKEEKGAYTGDISAQQLADIGGTHVLVGHSERREYAGETDKDTASKVAKALGAGLVPVLCVGETKAEKDAGQADQIVMSQLIGGLAETAPSEVKKIIIAYEPRWAIGTGDTCSSDDAEGVAAAIAEKMKELGFADGSFTVIYGGSVTPDNAREILSKEHIGGVLPGGASTKADQFLGIIEAAQQASSTS